MVVLKNLLILFLFILTGQFLAAQETTQKQIWPELNIYYKLNQKFRFNGTYSGTRASGEYTDGTAGIYLDYFARPLIRGSEDPALLDSARGSYLWFRTGYAYSDTPPNEKTKVINTFVTEADAIYRLPQDLLLINRNRFEWRFVNGSFQPIFRPRLKLLRNFVSPFLTFNVYIWGEYFFYLNENTQDRFRLAAGWEFKILSFMNLDTYFMYQFLNSPDVESLKAIGLTLKFYLKKKAKSVENPSH